MPGIVWSLLGIVLVAGAVGRTTNSLINDRGFPQIVERDGSRMLVPGFLGNIIISAVAAAVSWALYGPLTQTPADNITPSVMLATLGGAVLTGLAGSRWLVNAIDKNLMQTVAVRVANIAPSPQIAETIAKATPLEALHATSGTQDATGDVTPTPTPDA